MSLPELGTEIGAYRLDSVLGQGGMGCVYGATHLILGRKVALKLLAPELVSAQEYVSRFVSEARIVNGVRHPNIVDIHDFILETGRVAYVMEFVQGPSLGRLLREGPLTVRQAVNVVFQMAAALEAVHALGVIHRDLKPDNVLVLADRKSDMAQVPSIKILDFGIAKSSAPEVGHKTLTGSLLGTPAYMAPEQVAAEEVSPATDIYALAEIFYECISGERLYRGERMTLLRHKLSGEIPPLIWPQVPAKAQLDQLVRSCLRPDPNERPRLGELVIQLNEILSLLPDAPIPTPIPGSWAPPARTPRPEHTPLAMNSVALAPPTPIASKFFMGAVALFASAAVAAAALYFQDNSPQAVALSPPGPTPAPVLVEKSPEPKPAAEIAPEVAPSPPPAPAPEPVEPAPEPRSVKKTKKRPSTPPAPAAEPSVPSAPKNPAVVKKSELVPW